MPPSVDDGLPKDPLARFVVEIVEQWDLSRLTGQTRGAGSAAYHPERLLGLLIYGYATGRKRFLPEIERLFVEVLRIAQQMKLLKLGTVALEGTKLHANASRHNALSYGQAEKNDKQQISPQRTRPENIMRAIHTTRTPRIPKSI